MGVCVLKDFPQLKVGSRIGLKGPRETDVEVFEIVEICDAYVAIVRSERDGGVDNFVLSKRMQAPNEYNLGFDILE